MRWFVVLAVIASAGCSDRDRRTARDKPEDATPEAPIEKPPVVDKPTAFTHRLLIADDIAVSDLRKRVAAAAAAVSLSYTKGDPRSKCRRVHFLDLEKNGVFALQAEGMALRVRRKLDRTCSLESNRLAMSLNLRSGDPARAAKARTELTPTAELPSNRTRLRYRLDTSVGAKVYTPRYIAGGTVRGLTEEPGTLEALRAIYPGVSVEGTGPLVRVSTVNEQNYDFGSVSGDAVTMRIEVAVWSDGGAHVATELSYEYEAAEGAGRMATDFARALKAQLDGSIHELEWRENLMYQRARSAAPVSPESQP